MFYVTDRWPGGMLTNFATIKKSINRLKDIERMREDGTFDKLTKKEVAGLEKELAKLNKNFSGIVKMERMPKAIFIVDTKKEETAVLESRRLKIPIIGLIDTNSNPDLIAYPIPGNDDATKSVKLIVSLLADAVLEGRKRFLSYLSQEGVAAKDEPAEESPVIKPEEEEKIKEIGEIVELAEPVDGAAHPVKKAKTHGPDERPRVKRKV
jgi:small subunit ribosomal protein S2